MIGGGSCAADAGMQTLEGFESAFGVFVAFGFAVFAHAGVRVCSVFGFARRTWHACFSAGVGFKSNSNESGPDSFPANHFRDGFKFDLDESDPDFLPTNHSQRAPGNKFK